MSKPPEASEGAGPGRSRVRGLAIVAAVASNGVIGASGALPWRLKHDLRHFRDLTLGHAVVMGRRTWESLPGPLAGRENIVVTARAGYVATGARIVRGLDEALAIVAMPPPVFCIGGGELYRAALPAADRIYLTVVDAEPAGDTRMPEFDVAQWRVHSTRRYGKDERHAHDYRFEIHDRVTA